MLSPAEHRASPNLPPAAFLGERRRRVRLRLRTPSCVSLGSSLPGILLGPNEISDVSEEGISFETASLVEVGEIRPLSLQLVETNASVMLSGRIVWSGPFRRKGVEFVEVHADQAQKIKEWLFVSLLAGCSQQACSELMAPSVPLETATDMEDPATVQEGPPETMLAPLEEVGLPEISDYTATLAAVEAVRREAELLHLQTDAVLQLVAERAQSLTRAAGAAIALSGGEYLICRATTGEAPGLGVVFSVDSGFSGQCIRRGQMLYCADAESDPWVNAENCRALGVRSILGAPIRYEEQIVGLLEVFASQAGAFSGLDQLVVQKLAETAGETVAYANDAAVADPRTDPAAVEPVTETMDTDLREDGVSPPRSLAGRIVGAVIGGALVIALIFLVLPRLQQRSSFAQPNSQPTLSANAAADQPRITFSELEDLRRHAEQGDPTAQFSLGAHYALSKGAEQDYTEAARWFTMAAEQGQVPAESALGVYYASGTGVPKDLGRAYFWMLLARAGGDEPSRLRLADLASRMRHKDVVAAQQRADEWMKNHPAKAPASRDSL